MKVAKFLIGLILGLVLVFSFVSCDIEAKINDYAISLLQKSAPDDEFTYLYNEDKYFYYHSENLNKDFFIGLNPSSTMLGYQNSYITNYFSYKYEDQILDYFRLFFSQSGMEEGKDYKISFNPETCLVELPKGGKLINDYSSFCDVKNNPTVYVETSINILIDVNTTNTEQENNDRKLFSVLDDYCKNAEKQFFYHVNGHFCDDITKEDNSRGARFYISLSSGYYSSEMYEN